MTEPNQPSLPLIGLTQPSAQLSLVLNHLNRTAAYLNEGSYVYFYPDRPYFLQVNLTGDSPIARWGLATDPSAEQYAGEMPITSYEQLVILCRLIQAGVLPQFGYPHSPELN